VGLRKRTKVYWLDGEREPRFSLIQPEQLSSLSLSNMFALFLSLYPTLSRERKPRFTGLMKKENQGLQVG